ncbi:hypothetical protein G9A89_010517 [Geosiphon pyriformis]|nr:hypothetical protein G9A89_010517 [Geosiphon pyriformis]
MSSVSFPIVEQGPTPENVHSNKSSLPIKINVRFRNHLPMTEFSQLVSVRGIINKVTNPRPQAKSITFSCVECLAITVIDYYSSPKF